MRLTSVRHRRLKKTGNRLPVWTAAWLTLALCLFSLVSFPLAGAENFSEHRALVGLKLFRTLISADLNIKDKTNKEGSLTVAMLYADNKSLAEKYQTILQEQLTDVFDIPVMIIPLALEDLNTSAVPTAIFITQALKTEELQKVVGYCTSKHRIVFSPFEGDVKDGVLGGLSVQATVRPLINMQTLKQSQLNIKPFYLKVAKKYE